MLNSRRIGLLARKDAVENYRSVILAAGALIGVLLVIYIASVFSNTVGAGLRFGAQGAGVDFNTGLYTAIIIVVGLIITSRAFIELHQRTRNHDWFMLPASDLEKLITRLLITTVGFVIAVTVAQFVFSLIAAGITELIWHRSFPIFNPFSRQVLMVILHYFVVQSVFLFGAAYFKKLHFVKTLLSVIGVVIVLSLLSLLFVRVVYWDYFRGFVPDQQMMQAFQSGDWYSVEALLGTAGRVMSIVAQVIYWALLAPAFWVMTYIRLRETEVKDGV